MTIEILRNNAITEIENYWNLNQDANGQINGRTKDKIVKELEEIFAISIEEEIRKELNLLLARVKKYVLKFLSSNFLIVRFFKVNCCCHIGYFFCLIKL